MQKFNVNDKIKVILPDEENYGFGIIEVSFPEAKYSYSLVHLLESDLLKEFWDSQLKHIDAIDKLLYF
mgnify:CR=1 FL=1